MPSPESSLKSTPERKNETFRHRLSRLFPSKLARHANLIQHYLENVGVSTMPELIAGIREGKIEHTELDDVSMELEEYTDEREHRQENLLKLFDDAYLAISTFDDRSVNRMEDRDHVVDVCGRLAFAGILLGKFEEAADLIQKEVALKDYALVVSARGIFDRISSSPSGLATLKSQNLPGNLPALLARPFFLYRLLRWSKGDAVSASDVPEALLLLAPQKTSKDPLWEMMDFLRMSQALFRIMPASTQRDFSRKLTAQIETSSAATYARSEPQGNVTVTRSLKPLNDLIHGREVAERKMDEAKAENPLWQLLADRLHGKNVEQMGIVDWRKLCRTPWNVLRWQAQSGWEPMIEMAIQEIWDQAAQFRVTLNQEATLTQKMTEEDEWELYPNGTEAEAFEQVMCLGYVSGKDIATVRARSIEELKRFTATPIQNIPNLARKNIAPRVDAALGVGQAWCVYQEAAAWAGKPLAEPEVAPLRRHF